nr:hypothetical protein [Tanacetum cinerariifolium]
MAAGQRKPEAQWTADERKAANLDQLLKSLIMLDFQDSPDDEEDTRIIHELLNGLEEEYQAKALLAKSKRFFKKVTQSKNKGLIAKSHDWDEEEVSSDDKETEVKALMALTDEERISVGKESARNGNSNMSITSSNLHKLSKAKDSTLPNHDTDEVPSNKSQRNTTDPSAVVSDSPAHDYDSTDESSVCSTPLLPLKNLDGAEPCSRPKTVKSILKSKSTFKAKTLKGITLNEPSSAPARGNKSSSASKTNSAPAGKLKNVNREDDPPLAMNKGLIAKSHDWDEEEVSSDDKETKVKALMALTDEERISVGKESARNGNSNMSITSSNLHKSSKAKDSTLPNHDTNEVPSNKSQRNTTDPSAVISDSPAHDYDSTDESSVCSTPLLQLKNLDGAEPCSRPKTVKSILKEDDPPLAMVIK